MSSEKFVSSDEEMLTRGLKALAAEMESLEAPPAVEAKLREAFRARNVVVPIRRRQASSRYWLVAVAAMLLIVMGVVILRWNTRSVSDPRQAVNHEEPQEKIGVKYSAPDQLANDIEQPKAQDSPPRHKPRQVRAATLRRSANAQLANHLTNEIATDFIPLSYMGAASLQDGGQIVRVQLPRSSLANFGLPVNMDRYNEKVKADVLFGVDGLAHAIRFVQ
jgi:hypothetical protein